MHMKFAFEQEKRSLIIVFFLIASKFVLVAGNQKDVERGGLEGFYVFGIDNV